jgi:FkbM family methyltransferase
MLGLDATYQRMKTLGFQPSRILDIGAYKGWWTHQTRTSFPTAEFTLVEANDHPELLGLGRVHKALLNSTPGTVEWYSNGGTGDSMLQEVTGHFRNVTPTTCEATTLDRLFPSEVFDFIKIDCQGAELEILKGGKSLLDRTKVVLLECPFAGQYNEGCPSFCEYIQYMDSIGFTPFDISEIHLIQNITGQIDIMFIRKGSYSDQIQRLVYK